MADEILGQGATAQTTPAAEPEPTNDDKPKGPTPDEFIANAKALIDRQGNELGTLRQEVERMREERRLEQEQRLREAQYLRKEEPEPEADFDYTKPRESVRKVVEPWLQQELDRRDQARQQYEMQMRYEQAKANFFEGQERVFSRRDPIYEGIEKDVSDTVWRGIAQGTIIPEQARNEQTWETAAAIVRVLRGERDKIGQTRGAVNPPGGDIPTQVKNYGPSAGQDVELNQADLAMLEKLGPAAGIKSRDEAVELLRGKAKGK